MHENRSKLHEKEKESKLECYTVLMIIWKTFLQGMDSTIGLATYIGHPALEDCVLAKVLKHCGAVPFVKTNLPQLMLT